MKNGVYENLWMNKEITHEPYFSVWLKSSHGNILVFYLEIRDSHMIKLVRNDWKEWISLLSCEPSLIAVIFIFRVLFCFVVVVVVFFIIFETDSSFIWHILFLKLNLYHNFYHNYYNYSMFRNAPECSGMFHVPDFNDGLLPQTLQQPYLAP